MFSEHQSVRSLNALPVPAAAAEPAGGAIRPLPLAVPAGSPDGSEEDANDLDIVVGVDDVAALEEVVVEEGEDDEHDVEDDGEHEVEDRDPEERLDALEVRPCFSTFGGPFNAAYRDIKD